MLFNCLQGTGVWGYDKLRGIHISHRDISAKKTIKIHMGVVACAWLPYRDVGSCRPPPLISATVGVVHSRR